MAALFAAIMAVMAVGTAFAHHSEHQIQSNCSQGSYTYSADFVGGGAGGSARRVEVYRNNVKVHTQDFTGTTNVNNFYTDTQPLGQGVNVTYRIEMKSGAGFNTNQDNEEPDDVSVSGHGPCGEIIISNGACADGGFAYHFLSNDLDDGSGGTLFVTYKYDNGSAEPVLQVLETNNSSSPADWHPLIPFNGHGSITILSAYSSGGGVWDGNGNETVSSTQCVAPVTQIIVKKVFENGDTNTPFFATVDNKSGGNEGSGSGLQFNPTKLTRVIDFDSGDNSDDFDVTEAAVANWAATGWKVFVGASETACPGPTAGFGSDATLWQTGSNNDLSTSEFNLDEGQTATVCFRNKYTAPATPSVTVAKTNSTADNTVDRGEDFEWIITATVSGAATNAATTISDTIPAPVVIRAGAWDINDGTGNDASLTCGDQVGPAISCTIASGATVGTYIVRIPVEVPADASSTVCGGQYTNSATISGSNVGTPATDTDIVTVNSCAQPSVSVVKTTDTGTEADLNETFNYFIDVTVTNGPTVAAFGINDNVPNAFTVNSVTVTDLVNNPDKLTCTAALDPVDCTLAAGAASGTGGAAGYRITVNVTVPPTTSCNEDYTNDVSSDTGQDLSSVTVGVNGCGDVTFDKTAVGVVGNEVHWKVTFTNSAAIQQSLTIWDENVSIESETCVGSVGVSGDNYTCAVPANSTAEIVFSRALPQGYDPVCDSVNESNTASIAGNTNPETSDTAQVLDAANGGACVTVSKDPTTSVPPTWTITINNSADIAQTVFVVDDANFQSVSGNGTCNASAGDSLAAGRTCNIDAGGQIVITVAVPGPGPSCQGEDVDNSVTVWVGTSANQGTPIVDSTGNVHENVGQNSNLCRVTIQVCKVFQFDVQGELPNQGPSNFSFEVSDTEEDPSETLTLADVVEGGAPVCEILSVMPGEIEISEVINPGFTLDGWTIADGASPDVTVPPYSGTENPMSFFVNDELGCFSQLEIVREALGLVRNIESVIIGEGDVNDIECTITFFNHDDSNILPSGDLRIEKYLDINGDGDANDPGEGPINGWNMHTSGPEVNETTATSGDGSINYLGLETGDIYTVTEEVQAGYTVTNATVNGASAGAVTVAAATIPQGGTAVIAFYNQPKGAINIHKEAETRHNGITSPAPNDDDGWTITLDSEDCDIHFVGQTDANGNLSFTGLPLCTDYVVAEVGPNASSPGFVQVAPAGPFTNQTPEGQTLTFLNRRVTNDPPCQNCRQETPTPTSTPTTPTATPTTPVTTNTPTPTNTPTTPASPSVPVTNIAGERTPGPGQTPIAPSAGSGLFGENGSGFNLLLVLAGLVALTGGLSFLALGRKGR